MNRESSKDFDWYRFRGWVDDLLTSEDRRMVELGIILNLYAASWLRDRTELDEVQRALTSVLRSRGED